MTQEFAPGAQIPERRSTVPAAPVAAEPLISVDPVHVQAGDHVLIPVAGDMEYADHVEAQLRDDFPGVKFMLLFGTPMVHAIVYRPQPQPVARELCSHTWSRHRVEHDNHRCKHELNHGGNQHACRCGDRVQTYPDATP